MELQFNIIGIVLMALGAVHVTFPRYFNWKEELKPLSLVNKQLMEVHTFFIAFAVVLMGLLCVTSAAELIRTNLGRKVSLGFGIFWLVRLYFQHFVYSAKLWKGKKFETVVHVVFTFFWLYLSVVFLVVGLADF